MFFRIPLLKRALSVSAYAVKRSRLFSGSIEQLTVALFYTTLVSRKSIYRWLYISAVVTLTKFLSHEIR